MMSNTLSEFIWIMVGISAIAIVYGLGFWDGYKSCKEDTEEDINDRLDTEIMFNSLKRQKTPKTNPP